MGGAERGYKLLARARIEVDAIDTGVRLNPKKENIRDAMV